MKRILFEATRYERETGESLPRSQEQIIKYEEQGGYFIRFSNAPRIGLDIVNKYDTPIGFYAYPLNRKKMADFAVDRPYAIIFKPKPEAKLLDTRKYSESDYKADVDKLVDMGYSLDDINEAARKAKRQRPAGKIWNVTRVLSGSDKQVADPSTTRGGGPTGKWSMLLRKLGYDGVNDDCFSVIHHDEPCQVVFFDTGKIDLIKVLDMKGTGIKFKSDLFEPENKDLKQAADPKTSPKRLAMLAKSKNDQVRKSVAKNPSTLPETLRDLANPEIESNQAVREFVYSNPNCPLEILTAAAESSNGRLDILIAENPSSPPEVLRKLATKGGVDNSQLRQSVVGNENTPPDILSDLAKNDEVLYVRVEAISNPKIPVETLVLLATDKEMQVRWNVAKNEKTPRKTLIELSKDPEVFVSSSAKQTLKNLGITEALIMQKVFNKLLGY
jgi:hypothetical protein